MEWISVKDMLPNDRELVLICNDQDIGIGYKWILKINNSVEWSCQGNDCFGEATHWMPLPELPMEDCVDQ